MDLNSSDSELETEADDSVLLVQPAAAASTAEALDAGVAVGDHQQHIGSMTANEALAVVWANASVAQRTTSRRNGSSSASTSTRTGGRERLPIGTILKVWFEDGHGKEIPYKV